MNRPQITTSRHRRVRLAYTGQWNSTHSTNTTTGTAQSTQHLDGRLNDISRNLSVDSRQKVSKWLFTADNGLLIVSNP